jgi:hypothetical protein
MYGGILPLDASKSAVMQCRQSAAQIMRDVERGAGV